MHILSLAVGTSSARAAVVDVETATTVGPVARVKFSLDRLPPEAAEVPPDRLWESLTRAARQATRGQEGIAGVGLASSAPGLILLGANDKPLTPIWTPLDRRARQAARQVWAAIGEEFLRTTGMRPLPGGCSAVCFRQVLACDPYLFREVRTYLHVGGWLGLRLTGEKRFDTGNASLSGLFGTLTDRRWSPRLVEFFNIDPAWLPPVADGATTLGPLRPAVAAELGLPPGLPVKLGIPDTSSALLAARARPGDLLHVAGPTHMLAAIVDTPIPDARRVTGLLGVGDACMHLTHNPVGTETLNWLHGLCFGDMSDEQFIGAIEEARSRATRVTLEPPDLGGDPLEIEAHRAAFRNLTLSTDRLDLLAAVLAEMKRQHSTALAALGIGERFNRVVVAGADPGLLRRLLPEYTSVHLDSLDDADLRGVAALFLA